jgi:hypothetical protein
MALVVLLACVTAAPAKPGVLDLIPQDAAGAVAARDLASLHKKIDDLINDVEPNTPVKAGDLFAMLYRYLGILGEVDETSPGALVVVSPQTIGVAQINANIEQLLVAVVPFKDRDRIAANFGFKEGALKPDQLAKGKGENFGQFFYARGKHLIFGNNEKAVASVAKGKPLGAELPAGRRKSLNESDLLLHVNPPSLGKEWKDFLTQMEASLGKSGEKEEQNLIRLYMKGLAEIRHGFAAVRLDGGVGISFLAMFPREGKGAAQQFLKLVAGGGSPSKLDGLPQGNILACGAAGGDGSKNALVAKVFLNTLLLYAGDNMRVLTAPERASYVGVFTEVWQRLRGSRVALYQNRDARRLGHFSLVAILDTDNADKFITDMKELAHIAEGKSIDLTTAKARDIEGAKIEAMVRDLGNRRFRVRQAATTKLRLLGEPALAYLDKAIRSDDLEVSRRARDLRDQIEQATAQRRKDLLSKDLPKLVKPTYVFVARAETRGGCKVHIVNAKLTGKDVEVAPQLKELFGPDWDKIRLAVRGKQVVALVGSDVALLDEALANLKDSKPGLAASKGLTAFARQIHPDRRFEAHFSLERFLVLMKGPQNNQPADQKEDQPLTSLALTLEPDHVQLDVRVATTDIKAMVRENLRR